MTVGNKVLFSAMKNEGPFILEWVAYHSVIGFDRIIICSNDSNDGTTELLDALDAAGYIEHYPQQLDGIIPAQYAAANYIMNNELLQHNDWVIWLDADEFLNVRCKEGYVDDLISIINDKYGILIPWRVFGDSNRSEFDGRFISNVFSGCSEWSFQPNSEVKTLFRFGHWIDHLDLHRPLLMKKSGLRNVDFLNGKLRPLNINDGRHANWLGGGKVDGMNRVSPKDKGWDYAQINHYAVRTADYFLLKIYRGLGVAFNTEGESNPRHGKNFFRKYNRNEDVDTSILRWENAVTSEIENMCLNSAIEVAHQDCILRSNEAIGKLESQIKMLRDYAQQ